VAAGLKEGFAPGVQPMSGEEDGVGVGLLLEVTGYVLADGGHVLAVGQDGDCDGGVVGGDAFKSFEHFPAADRQFALGFVMFR